jgi:hypothetical protein
MRVVYQSGRAGSGSRTANRRPSRCIASRGEHLPGRAFPGLDWLAATAAGDRRLPGRDLEREPARHRVACEAARTSRCGVGRVAALDKYAGWRVKDEERKLVEADAGVHLGADPSDPTGGATLEASLLHGLWKERGWTISDTGGITHQTVSGFTATGSSGGSLQFSVNDNLWGFRAIDGTGEVCSARAVTPTTSFSPHTGATASACGTPPSQGPLREMPQALRHCPAVDREERVAQQSTLTTITTVVSGRGADVRGAVRLEPADPGRYA